MRVLSRFHYGLYWTVPAAAAGVWFAELVAMLAIWTRRGYPDYNRGNVTVPFVSDMFAFSRTLVIIMSSFTAGLYILSLFLERWLRHVDRIPGTIHSKQRTFDIVAIVMGIIGAAGLVILSVFNDQTHPTIHWIFALVFIVFTALCALFQLLEVSSLSKDHPDRPHLRRNGWFKVGIVTIAVAIAVAFAGTYGACRGKAPPNTARQQCSQITSAAAGLEWTDAFMVFVFFCSLVLDLWPAAKTSPRYLRRHPEAQHGYNDNKPLTTTDAFGRPSYGGPSPNASDPEMRQV